MLLRCFGSAVLFLSVVAAASTLTFAEPIAMLGWPGLLIVNAVCARFEIYERTPGNFGPMFAAGLVIDAAIYTLLFFFVVKGWRMFAGRSVTKR
jgi:hypothetical protein